MDEFVLDEVFHKLMITAVVNHFHCTPYQAIDRVKQSPDILAGLTTLWEAADLLQRMDLVAIQGPFFPDAFGICRTWNLLAADAVHVAAMKKEKISCIATNDSDFSRVSCLKIYRPYRTNSLL